MFAVATFEGSWVASFLEKAKKKHVVYFGLHESSSDFLENRRSNKYYSLEVRLS